MKINKIAILILILTLAINSTLLSFAADEKTETQKELTPAEMNIKEGKDNGKKAGTLDGSSDGLAAFYSGSQSFYFTSLMSDRGIANRYKLDNDDLFYKLNFIEEYKKAYQIAYNTAFRNMSMISVNMESENAYNHGFQIGSIEGSFRGLSDLYGERYNKWDRSYDEYIKVKALNERYWLDRESLEYRERFANGFKEGYQIGYISFYQEQNIRNEMKNINYKYITSKEDIIDFEQENVSYLGGSLNAESSVPVSLYISSGTVIRPVYISLQRVTNTNIHEKALLLASPRYSIGIESIEGKTELLKPLTLTFEYFGSEKGGIYKWNGNNWEYQYSRLEDGKISAEISSGSYSGGSYAIFLDNQFKNILDIRFNWAFKEIYTLMRRGCFDGGVDFKPEAIITKAELADWIYKHQLLRNPKLTYSKPVVSDIQISNNRRDAIEYMVSTGMLTTNSKNAFEPNNAVTYSDFERVAKGLGNNTFKWEDMAQEILVQKFKRSNGATNKNAGMTKAEAAYALIKLMK